MSFPYTTGLPNPPDNPSNDVSGMQQNTNTIDSYVAVDHVGFNNSAGGQHQQVTLPNNNTPSSPAALASVIYTGPGTALNSASQLFYVNSAITVQLSCVRAWGFITGTTITQGYNVASVTNPATGTYAVTLTSGAVSSASFAVLITSVVSDNFLTASIAGYTITGTGTFHANFRGMTGAVGTSVPTFSFIVLQV